MSCLLSQLKEENTKWIRSEELISVYLIFNITSPKTNSCITLKNFSNLLFFFKTWHNQQSYLWSTNAFWQGRWPAKCQQPLRSESSVGNSINWIFTLYFVTRDERDKRKLFLTSIEWRIISQSFSTAVIWVYSDKLPCSPRMDPQST